MSKVTFPDAGSKALDVQFHDDVFDDSVRHSAGALLPPHDQRFRSLSMTSPWRNRKNSLFAHHDLHNLPETVDDSYDADDHQPHGATQGKARRASGSIKGIFHRASMSLKGIVHRRASLATADTLDERPSTSLGAWGRLRDAATLRHSKSFFDLDHNGREAQAKAQAQVTEAPIPGLGDEPPVIPQHSGAAAKASAAMQNEFFAMQSRWMSASSDDNDRESGIGIAASVPVINGDEVGGDVSNDSNISRVDFVANLPTELAIHVLAYLNAAALSKASTVSRRWHSVIDNQHIWRESCLRETTGTYATSFPVQPGTGMGLPSVKPGDDWRKIYRSKNVLNQRWKEGKAHPVYLNGHTDSIYCLQFDE